MLETTKKLKRVERKKKKLEALIEITELNNKDRNEIEASSCIHGPSGDSLNTKHIEKKKKIEKSDTSHTLLDNENITIASQKDDSLAVDVGETQEIGEDAKCKKHRLKKKHKLKHSEEEDLGSGARVCEVVEGEVSPSVQSGSQKQKRKSSNETDTQNQHPSKMVKRHIEVSPPVIFKKGYEKEFNYMEELTIFKRDVKRKKKIDEKRTIKIKEDKKSRYIVENEKEYVSEEKDSCTEHYKKKRIKEEKNSRCTAEDNEMDYVNEQKNCISSEKKDMLEKTNYEKELAELRELMKERKKQLKELPTLRLKGVGKEASFSEHQRTPILPGDVQNLLLLSQMGKDCPRFPRWVELKKYNRLSKTVVLVVEGASAYDLYSTESNCPILSGMDIKTEMVSPYCYNAGVAEELCAVPITRQQKKDLERRFGKEICPEALLTDRIIKVLRSAFSISSVSKTCNEEVEQKISVPNSDKFPRTELLLSVWQLIEEGYPLPFGASELGNRYPDYVMTKEEYKEVTPSSPMWGLDCEMCLTRAGNELTRVSVVDEQHKTVYESFCVPPNPITNYLTEFSGITPQMLKGVTTKLEDIQKDLRELFPPDVILVGQSLGGDLHALKMMHPYVIDTSVIFNLTGNRKHKSKLSKLTLEFLNEAIQQRGAEGHDSVEDSIAALKLVQLKLTKSISFGDAVILGFNQETKDKDSSKESGPNNYPEHSAQEIQDLQIEVGPTMATSLFKHITMQKKKVAVIGQEETLAEYSAFVAAAHRESKQLVKTHVSINNTETISMICRECKTNNFTLAHVVLGEEEDITQVDLWMRQIFDSPPFNSLFIVVLTGSHDSFANGACLAKVKKPNLKLKPPKTD